MRLSRDHFWPFPYHFTPFPDHFRPFPDHFRPFPDDFRPFPDHFRPFRKSFNQFPTHSDNFPASSRPILDRPKTALTHGPLRGGTTVDHPATETGASSEPYQTTHGRYNMGPTDQNTGKSHRQQQHSHNTDVIFGPFTLHSTPILTRLPTISRPFQTTHHDHTRTTQGRYNGGPPGHQNTDNRHTAQSEPSRTTHGRYNMGPQGQES